MNTRQRIGLIVFLTAMFSLHLLLVLELDSVVRIIAHAWFITAGILLFTVPTGP